MDWLLVLGAKSDIAKAVIYKFAESGFNIYLACRNPSGMYNFTKDLAIRYGIKAETLDFDALDFKSHEKFYRNIGEKPLGVVCAFGYLGDNEEAKSDFNEARKIMETNYIGCVSILNIIANDFEKRKKGFIIGISSVAGDRGRQSNYYYGSAKAGFTAYLSGLRNRLHRSGISVLTVKPGFVRTQMTEGMELPPLLTAHPEKTARDIYKSWKKGKMTLYTKWFWRHIMLIIKYIPETIFKRMSL